MVIPEIVKTEPVKPETKACVVCGKEFPRPEGISGGAWGRKSYCSDKCKQSAKNERKKLARKTEVKMSDKKPEIKIEKPLIEYLLSISKSLVDAEIVSELVLMAYEIGRQEAA